MTSVALFKQDGSQNGTIELNADIFGIEPNENAEYEAILRQRASMRQGTHAVKNRSAVRGGGKKPWRQKGTGRARQGSIRAPQFRGGGIVFGPTPRSYNFNLPRKVRQLAIKSALSQKVADEKFVVVESINFDAPKTKEFAGVMNNLKTLKFNSTLTEFVFLGGGASVIKNFGRDLGENITIIEDVCINAKGYEDLLTHKYKAVS